MSKGDSSAKSASREVAHGAIRAASFYAFKTYLIPIGVPALAVMAGWAQGIPWMYVIVGASLTLAAVTTGLVRLDDWLEKRRVEGKLDFAQARGSANPHTPEIVLGLLFVSRAAVPIEAELVEIRTEVENRVPKKRGFPVSRFTITPFGTLFFDDHGIETTSYPRPGTFTGTVECQIRYGHPGALKHTVSVKKNVHMAFDVNGNYVNGSWSDAA